MTEEKEILNQLPCGVIVVDHTERIIYANNWIVEKTGIGRDVLYQTTISKIINIPISRNMTEQANLIISQDTLLPVYLSTRESSLPNYETSLFISVTEITNPTNKHARSITETKEREQFHNLIGKAPLIQEVYNFIEMAAETDANVIIQGESGTGKELVASAIHNASNRKSKPFVRVNCAALTETLLESELFGHTKGAFTGAYRDHQGKFEFADKGTIFLDEIGEIAPAMQAKLLRVIQERVVMRVGDNQEISVDVRVIAATNKNLRALVTKGKFREDLFYRLNVFPIHVPALREHKPDVPLLIEHFIKQFSKKTGKHIQTCSADVLRILMAYCWPGNIRELENTIEHAFVLGRTDEIQVVDLPHELRIAAVREGICAERIAGIQQTIHTLQAHMQNSSKSSITQELIETQLAHCNGNKTAAARALGISKVGLWKKMKKLGMQ